MGWKCISKNSKCQPSDIYQVIFGFIPDMKMGVSQIWYLKNQKISCFENLLDCGWGVVKMGKLKIIFFRFISLPDPCASWKTLKNRWEGSIKVIFWDFGSIYGITLQIEECKVPIMGTQKTKLFFLLPLHSKTILLHQDIFKSIFYVVKIQI